MSEPVYFVVEQRLGREYATVQHGHLQPGGSAVYTLRLDKLPPEQQQFWLSKGCAELLDVYRWLRQEGTLPPANLADPPKKGETAKRLLGDYWTPPPTTWPDRPADPFGAAGEIVVDGKLVPREGVSC